MDSAIFATVKLENNNIFALDSLRRDTISIKLRDNRIDFEMQFKEKCVHTFSNRFALSP